MAIRHDSQCRGSLHGAACGFVSTGAAAAARALVACLWSHQLALHCRCCRWSRSQSRLSLANSLRVRCRCDLDLDLACLCPSPVMYVAVPRCDHWLCLYLYPCLCLCLCLDR